MKKLILPFLFLLLISSCQVTPNYELRTVKSMTGGSYNYIFDTRTGELYERRGKGVVKVISHQEIKYAEND